MVIFVQCEKPKKFAKFRDNMKWLNFHFPPTLYLEPNEWLAEEDGDPEEDDHEASEVPVGLVEVAHTSRDEDILGKVHVEPQDSL